MKNTRCYGGQELVDHINKLWVTDEFKAASLDPNSTVYKTVHKICEQGPLFFYEMTDPIERTQFSSWWRHIQDRHYDNPAITDLYHHHEFTHIATMRLYEDAKPGTAAWAPIYKQWMIDVNKNELGASLESEVYVYLDMPTLRAKTFNHRIWADIFIEMLKAKTIEETKAEALKERLRILSYPNLDDPIEAGIYKYGEQNRVWTTYWKNNYTSINFHVRNLSKYGHVDDFQKFIANNTDRGVMFRRPTEHFHNFTKDSILTLFKAPA